jgi:DNA polymerase III delta prime subunit
MLNCSKDKADDCECLNCKWINEGSHPAVMTISRVDNKPEDDSSKTVISVKQSQMIKEILMNTSEFHRVFIFCDRDNEGNIAGLNPLNFQDETANSLLKIIEEPQPGVTFIFLTRYIDDVLSTIISRSQCFFVPSKETIDYDFSIIEGIFTDYLNFDRSSVFDVSQKLQDLSKSTPIETILNSIQNYILAILKSNPRRVDLVRDIKILEEAKRQAKTGIKPINIFDDICLKLIH